MKRANASHTYFVTATKTCTIQWTRIAELEAKSNLNEDEIDASAGLKSKFDLVLSADYQMSKLVPIWGQSPGLHILLTEIVAGCFFGIVNHATSSSVVHIFDESLGPKNTDYTLAYLTHYISLSRPISPLGYNIFTHS